MKRKFYRFTSFALLVFTYLRLILVESKRAIGTVVTKVAPIIIPAQTSVTESP